MIRRLLRRLRTGERGYTLIEMLMTLLMMGLVVGSLSSIFASGSRAQYSLNQTFVAQQQARMALDRIRNDIHCSSAAVASASINGYPGIKLSVGSCTPTIPTVDWCVVPSTQLTGTYALYRSPTDTSSTCTASDTSRQKIADYVWPVGSPASTANIFTTPTTSYQGLKTVGVDVKVTLDPKGKKNVYELIDSIVTRNSTRCTNTNGC